MPRSRHKHSSRRPRKTNTRQALSEAALTLLQGDKSLDALSLRELTREVGIVPTAFYRHYKDMGELGLALVETSFGSLRKLLREARNAPQDEDKLVRRSVNTLVEQVRANQAHFQFVARERFGGVGMVRQAIRHEIRLLQSELATDLARLPGLNEWTTEDLQMLATLLVNSMIATVEEVLERPQPSEEQEKALTDTAERQLRLIVLGAGQWRSSAK